ncbi:MAG: hypothetical protein COW02_07330, partial [Comamonadaceae bacterium CG12_big_fil_rev_8_21_14_0_65_59_15]
MACGAGGTAGAQGRYAASGGDDDQVARAGQITLRCIGGGGQGGAVAADLVHVDGVQAANLQAIGFGQEQTASARALDVGGQFGHIDFKVVGVFNCGVTRFNGEILLLMRVAEMPINNNPKKELVPMIDLKTDKIVVKEFNKADSSIDFSDSRFVRTPTDQYLTSISHLRIARGKNGIDFKIDKKPAIFPESKYERFGIEDPRITQINGRYYINYSAISDITGVTTCLTSTTDFVTFTRHGVIFMPDNKDVAIFPEKIKGRYYAL